MLKPILKWPGGKNKLLPQLYKRMGDQPKLATKYIEPFVGGGVVALNMFHWFPNLEQFVLTDVNINLMSLYTQLIENTDGLVKQANELVSKFNDCKNLQQRKSYYNIVRGRYQTDPVKNAYMLLFLSRACYEGLYRENAEHQFNTPVSSTIERVYIDKMNIETWVGVLKQMLHGQGSVVACKDFRETLNQPMENYQDSFIFIDPPYPSPEITKNFRAYTGGDMGEKDYKDLLELLERIHYNTNAQIMVTMGEGLVADLDKTEPITTTQFWEKWFIELVDPIRGVTPENNRNKPKAPEYVITNF